MLGSAGLGRCGGMEVHPAGAGSPTPLTSRAAEVSGPEDGP
ncbi:hypothetical protein FHS38_006524 [Streptomyces netropsis]|uniref:Uncharacterized protein n=1 Tax=Streptomyces netropsis TaxID=55404 RepID=A0A7W7LHT5_STRNE|nr:hypothetical protein [Streptomyces netropsis]